MASIIKFTEIIGFKCTSIGFAVLQGGYIVVIKDKNDAVPSCDWPMFRHDFRLTGRSEGKGDLKSPEIIAETVFATGDNVSLWMEDINMDGETEYIFSEGGRIRVKNRYGSLLWESDVCNPLILGFHNLDGKSQEKHIVAATELRKLTVFSGTTGNVIWEYEFQEKTVRLFHNQIKIGRINPAIEGEQITVWPEGDCYAYLFSFENGVANGHLAWRSRGIGIGDASRYRPNVLVGDVHGKGKNSIIVIQHSIIWVVDAETGIITQEIEGPDMRNYGYAGLFDVDNDGIIELVLVNDAVQMHISVIKMKDDRFEYLWDRFIGYTDYVMKTSFLPVCDVDGDGQLEIFYSIGSIAANKWYTEILDSADGKAKLVIEDAGILDCADVDGDGKCELLIEKASPSGTVICKITENGVTELFSMQKRILPVLGSDRPLWYGHVINSRDTCYFHDVDCDGYPEFLAIDMDVAGVYGYDGAEAIHEKFELPASESLSCLQAYLGYNNRLFAVLYGKTAGHALLNDSDDLNRKLLYSAAGELLAEFTCAADVYARIPIVTDIDNDCRMEIIIGDSVFAMDRHNDPDSQQGGTIYPKWRIGCSGEIEKTFPGRENSVRFLAAWDFNKDGRKELLFGNIDAELIMTDCDGNTIWRKKLKENFKGGKVLGCSVGRFLSADRYDIFVTASATADYMNECMVIEAMSGDIVWRRNDGHDRGMGPMDGYSAVVEFQGDGMDDLLFVSSDTLCCVDGKTGTDLCEKKELGAIMGTRWLGQGQLVLVDVDRDGENEAFLSGIWGLNGGILKWRGFYWQPRWFEYYGNATPIGTPPRHSHQGIAVAGDRLLAGGPRSDYRFGCYNMVNGDLQWTYDLGNHLVSEVCTGDIDGDGYDEFVFGCSDGYVYSLKHNGQLHFRVFAGALPGSPVLADTDGDGLLEIVVTTNQGKLLVIK